MAKNMAENVLCVVADKNDSSLSFSWKERHVPKVVRDDIFWEN